MEKISLIPEFVKECYAEDFVCPMHRMGIGIPDKEMSFHVNILIFCDSVPFQIFACALLLFSKYAINRGPLAVCLIL